MYDVLGMLAMMCSVALRMISKHMQMPQSRDKVLTKPSPLSKEQKHKWWLWCDVHYWYV